MKKLGSIFRFTRALILAVFGYCVYFGSVMIALQIGNSFTFADASWHWGGVLAFALASSELFVLDAWFLRERLFRRLMLSCGLTIASILAAGPVCAFVGIELHEQRVALFWPRIVVATPLFVTLYVIVERLTMQASRSNDG